MPRLQHSISSADDRAVAGLIARLLLHFWTPQDLSDGARKAMAEDWLTDLREFGPDLVAEACSRWRRSETKRPAIADIRRLCIDEQRERAPSRLALPNPARLAKQNEARDDRYRRLALEGREITDRWARAKGYRDFDDYLNAGGTIPNAWADMQRNGVPTQPHEPRTAE